MLIVVLAIGVVLVPVEEGTEVNAFLSVGCVHKVLEVGHLLGNDVSDNLLGGHDVAHVAVFLGTGTSDTDMEMRSGPEDGGVNVSLGKNVLNDGNGVVFIVCVSPHVFALYLQNVEVFV